MKKILLITSQGLETQDQLPQEIRKRFEVVENPSDAELVLVVGGDGTMLDAIRNYNGVPFVGLNRGHIGFLMNNPGESVLDEIALGEINFLNLKLLGAELRTVTGDVGGWVTAFNDFYVERAGTQTAHLRVTVNDQVRFDPLICDGVIVSSPAGSTAYNAAASGAILPLDSRALVLTGICPAIFHGWRSGILPETAIITIEALDCERRPVRFMTDGVEVTSIDQISKAVVSFTKNPVYLGFVKSQDFGQKVTDLQFGQH